VTVTFRDLWLRRQRAARESKFQRTHQLARLLWDDNKIEWHQIDTEGLLARQKFDMAQQSSSRENAKRNRLRAKEF